MTANSDSVLEDVRAEAKKLGKSITGEEASVKECGLMIPLTHRNAGSVLSPLRNS